MPLRALLNGESFYAWDLTEADRKREFTCPECEEGVIIVLPSLNIVKHFRHKFRASHDWKSESQTHLVMKRKLKKLADSYGYPCELEVKVSHGGGYRIADVLIKEKIVIECQCSRMSIKEYEERTKFYQGHEYQLIWLLGGRGISGLDLRIQQDYFDVFYYEEELIINDLGKRMTLEDIIFSTSELVLIEKREAQELQEREERERQKNEYLAYYRRKRPVPVKGPPTEKEKTWRNNWGANGWFTHPIIPPRRIVSWGTREP